MGVLLFEHLFAFAPLQHEHLFAVNCFGLGVRAWTAA